MSTGRLMNLKTLLRGRFDEEAELEILIHVRRLLFFFCYLSVSKYPHENVSGPFLELGHEKNCLKEICGMKNRKKKKK